jgi:hypothetical protein
LIPENETKGLPTVEATATPPPLAVVSFGVWVVVNPRIISLSSIRSSTAFRITEVPPIVILPLTFKSLLTCKSF